MTRNDRNGSTTDAPASIDPTKAISAVTLRDRFAMAAVAGGAVQIMELEDDVLKLNVKKSAQLAYHVADAMLAERAKADGMENAE